jgi:hypothetical protein
MRSDYALLAPCFLLVPFLSYISTLKMEAICSSETALSELHHVTI